MGAMMPGWATYQANQLYSQMTGTPIYDPTWDSRIANLGYNSKVPGYSAKDKHIQALSGNAFNPTAEQQQAFLAEQQDVAQAKAEKQYYQNYWNNPNASAEYLSQQEEQRRAEALARAQEEEALRRQLQQQQLGNRNVVTSGTGAPNTTATLGR